MDFFISIIVGISQAFIFNPIDKAIYKSVINNTSIINKNNFINPFAGALNGIYIKVITGGIYFYLIDYTKSLNMNTFQSSIFISTITSLVLNPLNYSRFNSFIDNNRNLYKINRVNFLITGIEAFILRDFLFNMIYINHNKDKVSSIYNCGIICSASLISSPFHYFRNMKYYHNNQKNYYEIYLDFKTEFNKNDRKINFICKKFSIGIGTIRTIAGIYYSEFMYSALKKLFNKY